jgi:hypothetical protein
MQLYRLIPTFTLIFQMNLIFAQGNMYPCQRSLECYNFGGNGSACPWIYCGDLNVTNGTPNGLCGYDNRIYWYDPGPGLIHTWYKSLLGTVTWGHNYYNVTVQRCVGDGCESALNYTTNHTYNNALYQSPDYLTSGGNVTIPIGATIDYTAGDYVDLIAGFTSPPGSNFSALPVDCYVQRTASEDSIWHAQLLDSILTLTCPVDSFQFGMPDYPYHNYYWDFGNGIISSSATPLVYFSPGTYTMNFYALDSINDTIYFSHEIIVEDCSRIGKLS